jgi:hypothetical protein
MGVTTGAAGADAVAAVAVAALAVAALAVGATRVLGPAAVAEANSWLGTFNVAPGRSIFALKELSAPSSTLP